MITETRRGIHLCYLSDKQYNGRILKIKDYEVEFKGCGQYVIEPISIIQGFQYMIRAPLSEIQKLPDFIEDLLEEEIMKEEERENKKAESTIIRTETLEEKKKKWSFYGERSCIGQILNRDLQEGEREKSLFIGFNLLLSARNAPEYARKLIWEKNASLTKPLSNKEIEDSVFGSRVYDHIGCHYIRTQLPYTECEKCRYREKKRKKFDYEKLLRDERLTSADRKVFAEIMFEEMKNKTEVAKECGISRQQVYNSIKKLRKLGYLA